MKAAAKKQIKLASYTEDRNKQKAYLRRNYKQVRAYFQYLKFGMLGRSTSLTLQSFLASVAFMSYLFTSLFFLADSKRGLL